MLIINILSPIYYCQPYEGLFCSSVKTQLFTQYFQIWVGEFLMCLFRFMANFSYVGFSISRLSLIGTDHSKFVKSFPDYSILVTQFISLILSGLLSTIKIFVYTPYDVPSFHNYKKETVPFRFDRNPKEIERISLSKPRSKVINAFNFISDFSNYVTFTIVFLALDIVLLLKLKKTLENKTCFKESRRTID